MFLRFNIPWNPSLEAILRHLIQPHVMTYINSHPEMFYKKVFLKVSQNSQESSCAEVSFSCNFNKNKALELVVSYEFCEIALTSKQKRQMCANVSQESVYIFWVYLNQIIRRTCLLQMLLLFYDAVEDEKYYYSDPIYRKFD